MIDIDSHAPVNRFVGVHGFAPENGLEDSPELQHARSTPWRARIISLLSSQTRRVLELNYEFGAAPRELLHLPGDEKIIDTHVPHDGYLLHYRLEGCADDSSPVLVFCNGLNCDLHMWDAAVDLLKPRLLGFRFLRYGRLWPVIDNHLIRSSS